MRIWFKIWKDNHMLRDEVIEDNSGDTRTHKVLHALETACHDMDLAVPIWLDSTVLDFKRHAKCRFNQDAFIETIDFDWFEMQVIEEDDR